MTIIGHTIHTRVPLRGPAPGPAQSQMSVQVDRTLRGTEVVRLMRQSAVFLRENWLSSRVFASYTDIIDHCCYAWNRLIDQPWIIMSIGLRDWANASNA